MSTDEQLKNSRAAMRSIENTIGDYPCFRDFVSPAGFGYHFEWPYMHVPFDKMMFRTPTRLGYCRVMGQWMEVHVTDDFGNLVRSDRRLQRIYQGVTYQ